MVYYNTINEFHQSLYHTLLIKLKKIVDRSPNAPQDFTGKHHTNEERVAQYLNNDPSNQHYAPSMQLKYQFTFKRDKSCALFLSYYQVAKSNLSRDQFQI